MLPPHVARLQPRARLDGLDPPARMRSLYLPALASFRPETWPLVALLPVLDINGALRAALEAWLLTWLVRRLPAGYRRMLERGDELPPSFVAAFAPDAPVYAAAVALGFLPDWILPGIRNRGMRSTPGLHLLPCRRSARAPPADRACHPFLQSAPPWGRPGCRRYHCKIGSLR